MSARTRYLSAPPREPVGSAARASSRSRASPPPTRASGDRSRCPRCALPLARWVEVIECRRRRRGRVEPRRHAARGRRAARALRRARAAAASASCPRRGAGRGPRRRRVAGGAAARRPSPSLRPVQRAHRGTARRPAPAPDRAGAAGTIAAARGDRRDRSLIRVGPRADRPARPRCARSAACRPAPDRNLALELVRVDRGRRARRRARCVGTGDKEAADQAAVDGMHAVLAHHPHGRRRRDRRGREGRGADALQRRADRRRLAAAGRHRRRPARGHAR